MAGWNFQSSSRSLALKQCLVLMLLMFSSCRVGGTLGFIPEAPKPSSRLLLLSPATTPFYSREEELSLDGICQPGELVRLSVDENLTQVCTEEGAFHFSVRRSSDGVYSFLLSETREDGQESAPKSIVWVRKTSVPPVSIITPALPVDSTFRSAANSLALVGGCESGSTVRLYEGTLRITVLDTQPCLSSRFQMTISRLYDAQYTFQIEQTDLAGNSSIKQLQWNKAKVDLSLSNAFVEVSTAQVVQPLGGNGSYTLSLSSNPSGATLSRNEQTGVYTYTAGLKAWEKDTIHIEDGDGFTSSVDITTHAAAADHLTIDGGSSQIGSLDKPFAETLRVVMRDRYGNSKPNEMVLFTLVSGDIELRSPGIVTTNNTGKAEITVQAGVSQRHSRVSVSRLGAPLPDLSGAQGRGEGGSRVEFRLQAASRGTGSFGRGLITGSSPEFMLKALLNGDARADIAISNSASNSVQIFLQGVSGSYGEPQEISGVCDFPQGMAAADFNGDSRTDLAVACSGSDSIVILFQDSEGFFNKLETGSSYLAPGGPRSLVAVDFNHDGKPDIAAVAASSSRLIFLRNELIQNGSGALALLTFENAEDPAVLLDGLALSSSPSEIRAADLSGDGIVDLAIACSADGVLEIWKGVPAATPDPAVPFLRQTPYSSGTGATGLEIADLNADGRNDVAVLNPEANTVALFFGAPDGSLNSAQLNFTIDVKPGASGIAWEDWSGDGKPDIVVVGAGDEGSWIQEFAASSGTATFQSPLDESATSVPSQVVIGDFNADGSKDIALLSRNSNSVEFIYGHGDGKLGTKFAAGAAPSDAASADFNRDGKPDLAVLSSSENSVQVLRGSGNGLFTRPDPSLVTLAMPTRSIIADLNADGWDDIVVIEKDASSVGIFINSTESIGAPITFSSRLDLPVGSQPVDIVRGDWNEDGKLDLAVANSGTGTVSILSQGASNSWTATSLSTGASAVSMGSADFNGDGHIDLMVISDGGFAYIHRGTGQGSFQPAANLTIATSVVAASVADFDGDGDSDLSVLVPSLGEELGRVYLYLNNGTGDFSGSQNNPFDVGATGTAIQAADMNGDGTMDFIVSTGIEGGVRLLAGQAGGNLSWTSSWDMKTPLGRLGLGDFNRDGAPDFWVLRTNSGEIDVKMAIPSP